MKNYKINMATKTLTITKDFEEKAMVPNSEESKIIEQFRNLFPDLRIAYRTHKVTTKNPYKGLTYERMEAFVKVFKNKPELKQNYDTVKLFAEASSKNGYAIVRDWFLTQFPEYRQNALYYLKNEVKVIDIISFLEKVDNKNNLKEVA